MASDEGILSAVDAMTGKVVWSKRAGGTWAASPVYAAGKIYFFDIEGKGYVLKPGDEYTELAVNKLDAGCMASPAVVEGALIVRTKQAVYRIGEITLVTKPQLGLYFLVTKPQLGNVMCEQTLYG